MKFHLSEYGHIRVASISPEMKVADVDFNLNKIKENARVASELGASVILFPELSLTSYTCGDLFFQNTLIESSKNSLIELAQLSEDLGSVLIVGLPLVNADKLFNVAAVLSEGEIKGIVPKTYLCNYNEYYEERWFTSANYSADEEVSINGDLIPFGSDLIFSIDNHDDLKFGIEICEDLWSVIPPSSHMAASGTQMIFNLSASNETLGKNIYRKDLVASQSARTISAYVYSSSNAGESSTDLVFSGHNLIYENGSKLAESDRFLFEDQITLADIDYSKIINERLKLKSFAKTPTTGFRIIPCTYSETLVDKLIREIPMHPFVPGDHIKQDEVCKEIFSIQSTALAKRLKHIGTKDVVIGVSGGLDSTLALLVCKEAFDKLDLDLSGIHAIIMPGPGSTNRTQNNAKELASSIGVTVKEIDIHKSVEQHLEDLDHPGNVFDITYENAQARERTQILMNYSNKYNGIVVGTGDLSELALGWCTYNGDHMSMYGVNAGVPKTLVKYIISWVSDSLDSSDSRTILQDIIDTPISPELIPDQKTEDHVGPYELHDFFLYHMFRFGFEPQKILFLANIAFKDKYNNETILKWLGIFYRRFFMSQFKRSAMPDSIKVGSVVLSPRGDWRMPSDAQVDLWIKQLEDIEND